MQPDYSNLIDSETWSFIDRINAFYPPEAAGWPMERNRNVYDRMCREFHAGIPAGVAIETSAIDLADRSLPIRIYANGEPAGSAVVLYFHGGGFILGGLDSHDDICAEICDRTALTVISVDYRLAPDHRGTAAFDDAVCAYEWTAARYAQPVLLVGESAGGTLAACIAGHVTKHSQPPCGQVLIYPLLSGANEGDSYIRHRHAPLLSADDVVFYRSLRGNVADMADDELYTPLACTNFASLPPTAIFTAECDPLASDGDIYCQRLLQAGRPAAVVEAKGLPHGYLRARTSSSRAAAAFASIVQSVTALGLGEWNPSQ
ncbi:alpha/beta hydrolase [Phyllobacterium sp. SB3]|uniref:alpha/beta hydrolase n=1 Tax=Phyllobacterium sp. SB3 TaxID=3156073 RepID=UPI0032AF3B3B